MTSQAPAPKLRILSETKFEVIGFGTYHVNDTANLETVTAILDKPDWSEDELNRAVAELNRDPEAEREEWQATRRRELRWNESDCGGVFDGNGVLSDADPGL